MERTFENFGRKNIFAYALACSTWEDTVGCITHRNFSLENIVVLNDASGEPNYNEVHLLHPASGVYGAILPMLDRAPGLRDLRSGYRSLELNDSD